jgi:DNA-binding transcriptional regulator GbsR (MarR family)
MQGFVEYFGALGPRWGLDGQACRVHAYLYLLGRPTSDREIARALNLDETCINEALSYLVGYRMVDQPSTSLWQTGGDPWDMLLSALEERRRREIGPALTTLRECHRAALDDSANDRTVSLRIGKLLALVEDLATLDNQTRRFSPRLLRGLLGISGRAARLVDRAVGHRKGED